MPTDLTTYGPSSAGTLNFLAVGGSGIRTVVPLLHLCAAGLGPRKLHIVMVDPDVTNPATSNASGLIEQYQETRKLVGQHEAPHTYFRTDVTSRPVWSPIVDGTDKVGKSFADRVDRSLMDSLTSTAGTADLSTLCDLLFAAKYQRMDLSMGFRGVPPIGTVFMNRLREETFFKDLLNAASADANSVFFAAGSVFGGTGAAALPVIGRALVDGLPPTQSRARIDGVQSQRVGAALLLPFFTLPAGADKAPDGGPRPQAALFAQNAAAAIPTYVDGMSRYGALYVLGDDEPREQRVNAVGGKLQDNRPDYIELFAALAALDFACRGGAGGDRPVFFYTAVDSGKGAQRKSVSWPDLPLSDASVLRLKGAFVAAHTFLRLFRPNGNAQPDLSRLLKGVTWVDRLGMRSRDFDANAAALDRVGNYFMAMWKWLAELRTTQPPLELVRAGAQPLEVRPGETLDGMRTIGKVNDVFEIMRHWNEAAYSRTGTGQSSLWEVMRTGSERFVHSRLADAQGTTEE